jgi:hypothetical protein
VCGADSVHARLLHAVDTSSKSVHLAESLGICQAAHSDYVNGFLSNVRHAIHAEISDDFLTQAEALLAQGYHPAAAASIAGAVLEDTLRTLCVKHSVLHNANKTSIEALNVELARAEVYDRRVQKRITAESDIRNDADHGRFQKVKREDVAEMVRWVRRFVSEWLP